MADDSPHESDPQYAYEGNEKRWDEELMRVLGARLGEIKRNSEDGVEPSPFEKAACPLLKALTQYSVTSAWFKILMTQDLLHEDKETDPEWVHLGHSMHALMHLAHELGMARQREFMTGGLEWDDDNDEIEPVSPEELKLATNKEIEYLRSRITYFTSWINDLQHDLKTAATRIKELENEIELLRAVNTAMKEENQILRNVGKEKKDD